MIQQMLAFWSLVPLPFLNPAWTSGSESYSIYRVTLLQSLITYRAWSSHIYTWSSASSPVIIFLRGYTLVSEKAMATHSSTLAWKIPWMEETGRLQSIGSQSVGHDWATSLSLFTLLHWRRKWQPTPVFLPGQSQGWWSLVGCRLWGHTESDMTEAT